MHEKTDAKLRSASSCAATSLTFFGLYFSTHISVLEDAGSWICDKGDSSASMFTQRGKFKLYH